MAPVDDEDMALGLAADGLVNGRVEEVVALRGAKWRPKGSIRRLWPGLAMEGWNI
jgi:hypothetical protein